MKNLAQINVADGSRVTTFNPATVDGRVLDLRLSNNRLWLAGAFTHVAGKAQKALATVNPTTGKFDPYFTQVISGLHNGGTTTVHEDRHQRPGHPADRARQLRRHRRARSTTSC